MDFFNPPFWIFVAVIAGIYAIFALGLYLQYALAGLPNFGHVAFVAVAAYTMAILVIHLECAAAAGGPRRVARRRPPRLVLGIPSLRLRADYLAIATVAGGEIVRYLAINMQGLTGGPIGSIGMLGPSEIAHVQPALAGLARPRRAASVAPAFWAASRGRGDGDSSSGRSPSSCSPSSGDWCARPGAACCGPSARTRRRPPPSARTSFAPSCRRWSWARSSAVWPVSSSPGRSASSAPDDYQPTLTFYAYLILILGGMNRIWAIPVGAAPLRPALLRHPLPELLPLSLFDSGIARLPAPVPRRAAARPVHGDPARRASSATAGSCFCEKWSRSCSSRRGQQVASAASPPSTRRRSTSRAGSITALIGPNGAGKTTVFNFISGFLRPDARRDPLRRPADRARSAATRSPRPAWCASFQIPRVLTRMTVLENMMLAGTEQPGERLGAAARRAGPGRRARARGARAGARTARAGPPQPPRRRRTPARSPAASASCSSSAAR